MGEIKAERKQRKMRKKREKLERKKSILVKAKDRPRLEKGLPKRKAALLETKPRNLERSYRRKDWWIDRKNRQELEITRKTNTDRGEGVEKQRKTEREKVMEAVKGRVAEANEGTKGNADQTEKAAKGPEEWKEQVVRVGTGYRVRLD